MRTDGFYLVFFFSFDERARLRNKVRAEFRSLFIWREERCVEDAMHLPGWWESKAVGVRGNNLRDFEWAFSSRGQFSRGEVNLQVSRVKPYLRSYFPRGELCSNPFFDCLSGFGVSGGSLFAGSIKESSRLSRAGKNVFPIEG